MVEYHSSTVRCSTRVASSVSMLVRRSRSSSFEVVMPFSFAGCVNGEREQDAAFAGEFRLLGHDGLRFGLLAVRLGMTPSEPTDHIDPCGQRIPSGVWGGPGANPFAGWAVERAILLEGGDGQGHGPKTPEGHAGLTRHAQECGRGIRDYQSPGTAPPGRIGRAGRRSVRDGTGGDGAGVAGRSAPDAARLRHRFLPSRIARGKCYELRHLPVAERRRLEEQLRRHAEVCDRIGDHANVVENFTATFTENGGLWWVPDRFEEEPMLAERRAGHWN